jgi:hypothetical protein
VAEPARNPRREIVDLFMIETFRCARCDVGYEPPRDGFGGTVEGDPGERQAKAMGEKGAWN